MEGSKQERMLEIFFRGLRGEDISIQKLATQYSISTKSISRTINDIKAFLADHRELVGNTELQYSHRDKCYRLRMDEFLTNQELFALIEVVIGARAFSKEELLLLTSKLKAFTTTDDRAKLNELIRKELYHYTAVKHDCESVQDMLWQLVRCITEKREITVEYFRSDRAHTMHRLRPASVMFTDFYFYLIRYRRRYGKAPVFPRRPHQAPDRSPPEIYDGRRAGLRRRIAPPAQPVYVAGKIAHHPVCVYRRIGAGRPR